MKKVHLGMLLVVFFLSTHEAYSAQTTVQHVPTSTGKGPYERSITIMSSANHPLKCTDVALQMERWEHWLWTHMNPSEEREKKVEEHKALSNWFEDNCTRHYSLIDLH
jgi:hypothetical protein